MTIKIESLDHQGRGIAHLDGKVIFIPNTLPNELIEFEIVEEKKKYAIGKVTNIKETSPNRVEPTCPFFHECGGCHLSHLNYLEQLIYKTNTLIDIIKKYASINVKPSIIKAKESNYRNKVTLKVENYKWGYYKEGTHNLVKIDNCLLAEDAINKIIKQKDLIKIKNGEIIIRANYNDEIMIAITSKTKVNIDLEELTTNNKIVGIIINDKIYYGENNFIEIINNKYFSVDYNSFFQINNKVLTEVCRIINNGEYRNVLDLYCGVGVLGLSAKSKRVYGIEIAPSSIKNALKNAKMNNKEAFYLLGDSSKMKSIDDQIDTIIVDPPRNGINEETLKQIIEQNAEDIIYMSCNPLTLARDLKTLKDNYELEYIYLLDMFPQTYHIECLVKLIRKQG